MNRTVTDQEHQTIISVYFDQIENAVKTARIHMAGGAGGRPEVVDFMFEFIIKLASRGQQFKWPDPAKLALAAQQDPALQKLLKRASKPTPIRATAGDGARRAKKGGAL
jgi:hypothetical protein